MYFWKNINHLRNKKGWPIAEVIRQVKIHSGKRPEHVGLSANIKGKRNPSPSVETVETYSKIFSISMDELLYVDLEEREKLLF